MALNDAVFEKSCDGFFENVVALSVNVGAVCRNAVDHCWCRASSCCELESAAPNISTPCRCARVRDVTDKLLFAVDGSLHTPERAIRQLAGDDEWSVNGLHEKFWDDNLWLARRYENGVRLSIATRYGADGQLLISASAAAQPDSVLGVGVCLAILSPLVGGVAAWFLGAGWWSLAVAPTAFFVSMYLLMFAMRLVGRRRAPTERRLLEETSARIQEVFDRQCTVLGKTADQKRTEERSTSLGVTVDMMMEALDKSERCASRGDSIGVGGQLRTCQVLFYSQPLDLGSDVIRQWESAASASEPMAKTTVRTWARSDAARDDEGQSK